MPKYKNLFKLATFFGVTGAAITAKNIRNRYCDDVHGHDDFSKHTRTQHQQNLFSGMHKPFFTTNAEQLSLFKQDFSEYTHLLPTNLDELQYRQARKTPVHIKRLSDCPVSLDPQYAGAVVVGGPPALMSAVSRAQKGERLTYIRDNQGNAIYPGAAFHLEQDAETEAPTSYKPSTFLANQALRAATRYDSLVTIEKTGRCSWRTLDWMTWMQHIEHWPVGMRVAWMFQVAAMANPAKKQNILQKVAEQCKMNEKFYDDLNKKVGGTLLMPGKGSLIVARNKEEIAELLAMKIRLENEGRTLTILSKEEIKKRFGFVPNGMMYGEKQHGRVLSSKFMDILSRYIQQQGGTVINGTLTTVYADTQQAGGVAEYLTPNGQRHYIRFSCLSLSLGAQAILDTDEQLLFDVVAARGVSVLAYMRVPSHYQLPSVIVCGGTNHLTKLSEKPVTIQEDDGKLYNLYLMRMTAGACITPNVLEKQVANYDGSVALGLVTAAQQTLGNECKIDPLLVYGCNRQVSGHGQLHWIEPLPGIYIQYGAGGGGLTRAPDFAVQQEVEDKLNTSPRMRQH